jgi:hypothetical protein
MGIDVYASWPGQTREEAEKQHMEIDFSNPKKPKTSWRGDVGYLREGYDGPNADGLFATRVLVPEAFSAGTDGVRIPASVMRERLPEALAAVRSRALFRWGEHAAEAGVYIAEVSKSFCDFVALCEGKEREHGYLALSWLRKRRHSAVAPAAIPGAARHTNCGVFVAFSG